MSHLLEAEKFRRSEVREASEIIVIGRTHDQSC